ncbi:OB-fold domain-containing protein [Falsiroseomonas tokyonensis]|uniref:OB-fold domain-containing protein n=1 Tax=Falsiroseomonas tokyonensis TaxID=430521 RepID=A0ABV7C0G2_9PROT|nr:OB-fold domain-containing protein [Falsiroseomonas tokyonensis]MBU8540164.1 OB-fold domain-containing protein [Falsiroseomonas tokyonensis]
MDLRDPALYAPAGHGDAAVLLALRDPATGALAFPRTPYGIGASGTPAEAAEPVELSGRATLLVCVTVHQPLSPGMQVPLVVARLRLEEGLVIDGVLEGTEEPPPGSAMQAVLVMQGERRACRFRLVGGAA